MSVRIDHLTLMRQVKAKGWQVKVYYKATRPDGFDFYSRTVDYASHLEFGTSLKLLTNDSDYYRCCSGTVYHASGAPSETLIGGEWPCRLFEVEGEPVAQEGHKYGFRSLRVVREIEAWRALGPNGQEVAALIEKAATITVDQAKALAAARVAAGVAAGDAARVAAWAAAWDAARAAARALVVRDLITPEQFDLLYGPWRSVMGS